MTPTPLTLEPRRRREHIKCVQSPADPRHSVCGRYVFYEFRFSDWQHAEATAQAGSRLTVCRDCKRKRGEP